MVNTSKREIINKHYNDYFKDSINLTFGEFEIYLQIEDEDTVLMNRTEGVLLWRFYHSLDFNPSLAYDHYLYLIYSLNKTPQYIIKNRLSDIYDNNPKIKKKVYGFFGSKLYKLYTEKYHATLDELYYQNFYKSNNSYNLERDSTNSRILLSRFENEEIIFVGKLDDMKLIEHQDTVRLLFRNVFVVNNKIKSTLYYDHINLFLGLAKAKKLSLGHYYHKNGTVERYHRSNDSKNDPESFGINIS
ncbi:hypothetical protein JC2156_10180 [Weissella koreensis KCTC 3621]|uniref:hypothetical protein n=1 Tax=Weissella koreensis TaxID=165096 RepID=UPI00026F3388|nr:hypothetical protein [Weissella koreensis]EJF33267.1 hypothetical protein JC2156_10180 [Weissella koreensis KCTC 3621]